MDLARVDMMGFALVVVAAALAQRRPLGGPRAAALGVAMCAAVYTKQTNVFYVAWIVLHVASRDRRGAIVAVVVATALAVPPLVLLQRATGGWFLTWMTVMRFHPIVPAKCAVAAASLILAALALARVLLALHRRGRLRDASVFWCGMLVAAVPACIAPNLTEGGWVNNLIGLAMIALLLSLLLLSDWLSAIEAPSPGAGARQTREARERWVVGVASALLVGALYDPMLNVPDSDRRRDVDALHDRVRALAGDVLIPMYPFVAARDGKSTPQVALLASLDSDGKGGLDLGVPCSLKAKRPRWILLLGHPQETRVSEWMGDGYSSRDLELRVQALKETTGRSVTLLERRGL